MFEFLSDLAGQVVPVLKVALPAVAAGAVLKHGTKLPNNLIPYANGILGAVAGGLTGGPEMAAKGAMLALFGGTATHQLAKVATRAVVERFVPSGAQGQGTAVKVGPGERFSP